MAELAPVPSVADAADAFITAISDGGYAPSTTGAYRSDLNRLLAVLDRARVTSVAALDTGDLATFLRCEAASGLTGATLERRTFALRRFTRYLADRGLTATDVGRELRPPTSAAPPTPTITPQGVESLLNVVTYADNRGPAMVARDAAMVALIYDGAIRVSELVALDMGDLDLGRGQVRVRSRGRRLSRVITLSARAAGLVGTHVGRFRGTEAGPLFANAKGERLGRQGLWWIVTHYARKAGFRRPVHGRLLRATRAAELLIEGAHPSVVGERLGITGPAGVARYAEAARLARHEWRDARVAV